MILRVHVFLSRRYKVWPRAPRLWNLKQLVHDEWIRRGQALAKPDLIKARPGRSDAANLIQVNLTLQYME